MVERFRQAFHLDQPPTQYAYLWRLLSGRTFPEGRPACAPEDRVISQQFAVHHLQLTWMISFPVGIRSAIFRGGVYDRSATFISMS
jgi:peptide/nickel transport system permease protein